MMSVLFISRGSMSGVRLVVDCLTGHSKLRAVSREDLVEVVNQHGELAARVVERLATADRAYDQFSKLRRPYVVLMRLALLENIREDNVVYHGYSGHFLLPMLRHFVRVRVDAPLAKRVPMTMDRLACDEATAREYIAQEDERRVRWARFMYGRDVRDTSHYDLWINLSRTSLETACAILERTMELQQFATDDECRAEVERLLMAARVEAELVSDPRTHTLEIHAETVPGGVELMGPYVEPAQIAVIKEIAAQVEGGDVVRYTPGYAPTLGMTP
jgi:cytidylate kinase